MVKIKLIDLYMCVQSALVASGTGKKTVKIYRCSGFHPLQRFFEKKGCIYYSRKLADEFVLDTLNAYKNNLISRYQKTCIRKVAAMLDEYKNTGAIKWAYLPKHNATFLTCKHFEIVLTQYVLDMSRKEKYSPLSIAAIKNVVKQFLCHLEKQGHRKLSCLTRKIVSDYIPIIAKRRPGGVSEIIHALKSFLGYLHENKHITSELVSVLPSYPTKRKKHFAGFTREDVKALICSVPSNTNLGKRNIAIFTLAENTGLRAIDVTNLKLNNIDWRNKTISIIQHKTKQPLILPFENRVGDALAEYILHGRPVSDSPFIFLSAQRPFRPVSAAALSAMTSKYIKLSGIGNNSSIRRGFHCFRRSIGTWLLEAELPLTMISEILGHAHIDSAKPYLSTDHERLRECAIGLEGIEIRKGVFQ
jgi:integrase